MPERRRLLTPVWLGSLLLITAVAFVVVATSADVDLADSQQTQPARATLTVMPSQTVAAVPPSYLGISTEYWALPLYAQRMALFERVLSLLRVPGNGPLVLRVGGDSADHAFWDPRLRGLPRWAFSLTPKWLGLARALVHSLGARMIIDLNLINASPATAAGWARAAESGLPRRSIIGFEVGNEPDIYSRAHWFAATGGRMMDGRPLPARLTAADYVADFRADATAIGLVAPHVPLLGPALANPRANAGWIARLLASRQPGLRVVSVHRYPYSACVRRRSPSFPTIARLLSQSATAGVAKSLHPAVTLAHRAGLPLQLTELNSITCSGRPGVSDAFASALWAPAVLLDLVRAGVAGVNLHIRADAINAPFALGEHGLTARPLLYGLVLLARALGSDAELVRLRLRAPESPHLSAWAIRVGDQSLRVLLINDGGRAVRVSLRLGTAGRAWVQRLLAPSPRSRIGVTLNGQQLGRDGLWQHQPAGEMVTPNRRGYRLTVPRFSAALLGARLSPDLPAAAGPQLPATRRPAWPLPPSRAGARPSAAAPESRRGRSARSHRVPAQLIAIAGVWDWAHGVKRTNTGDREA